MKNDFFTVVAPQYR